MLWFLLGLIVLNPVKLQFMETYGCSYYYAMEKAYGSEIADVIVAQSAIESNWGRAHWVENNKQLSATYDLPSVYKARVEKSGKMIDKLRRFKTFSEYYKYKSKYYTRKKYDTSSKTLFILGLSSYAEDPKYINKVRLMYKDISYLRRVTCTE